MQLPAVMRPDGKVRVMVSDDDDAKSVAVMTATLRFPDVDNFAVGKSDSVFRVTQPTQGVATCAA